MRGRAGKAALAAVVLLAAVYFLIRADVARMDAVERERAHSAALAAQLTEQRRMLAESLAVSANIEARGNDPLRGLLLARETLRVNPEGADGLTPENRALLWYSLLFPQDPFIAEAGGGETDFIGRYAPYVTWPEGEEGRAFLGGRVYRFDVRERDGNWPEAVWEQLAFRTGENPLWMATPDPGRLLVQEGGKAWLADLRAGKGRKLDGPVFPPGAALLDSGHGIVLYYEQDAFTRVTLSARRLDMTADAVLSDAAPVVFDSREQGAIINVAAFAAAGDRIVAVLSIFSEGGSGYEIHVLEPEFRDGKPGLKKGAVRKIPLSGPDHQPELHNAKSVSMWQGTGHRFHGAVVDKESGLFVFADGKRSRVFDLNRLEEIASCAWAGEAAGVRVLDGGRALAFAMSSDTQHFFRDVISIRRPQEGCPEAARIIAGDRTTSFEEIYEIDLRAQDQGYFLLPVERTGATKNWIVPIEPMWAEAAQEEPSGGGGTIPTAWLPAVPAHRGAAGRACATMRVS